MICDVNEAVVIRDTNLCDNDQKKKKNKIKKQARSLLPTHRLDVCDKPLPLFNVLFKDLAGLANNYA